MARKLKPAPFKVTCDETNNTPESLAEGKLVCDVVITFPDPRESAFPGTGTRARISSVALEGARELVTILPEALVWDPANNYRYAPPGAIVRLKPPASATDADVDRVRAHFEKAGALRVFVAPRPRSELIPSAALATREKACGARDAVLALVRESSSKDREKLASLCEAVMAEVGL